MKQLCLEEAAYHRPYDGKQEPLERCTKTEIGHILTNRKDPGADLIGLIRQAPLVAGRVIF